MPKINFHVILKFIGIILCMESIFMLVPFVVALIYGEGDAPAFIKSASITASVGGILFYIFRNSRALRGVMNCIPSLRKLIRCVQSSASFRSFMSTSVRTMLSVFVVIVFLPEFFGGGQEAKSS